MKTNQSTTWICIIFLCLVVAAVIILLTIPLLAKGISHIIGNLIEPEKLDISPIPVPVPPPTLAISEPSSSATPTPSTSAISPVPQPIPVPTATVSGVLTGSSVDQVSLSESATALRFPVLNQEGFVAIVLIFLPLLISVCLQRGLSLHTLNRKMQHDRSIC